MLQYLKCVYLELENYLNTIKKYFINLFKHKYNINFKCITISISIPIPILIPISIQILQLLNNIDINVELSKVIDKTN